MRDHDHVGLSTHNFPCPSNVGLKKEAMDTSRYVDLIQVPCEKDRRVEIFVFGGIVCLESIDGSLLVALVNFAA